MFKGFRKEDAKLNIYFITHIRNIKSNPLLPSSQFLLQYSEWQTDMDLSIPTRNLY